MNPRSWLAPVRLFILQDRLIKAQRAALNQKQDELNRFRLDHFREVSGLLAAWRISIEHPEWDFRDQLSTACADIDDRVAALEELIV